MTSIDANNVEPPPMTRTTNRNFNDAFRKVNDTHSTIAVGPRQEPGRVFTQ
jgi:hypothetical protein